MKKNLHLQKWMYFTSFVFGLFLLLSPSNILGQCTNASSFGSATVPSTPTTVTISTCSFLSEYSTLNGVAATSNYSCSLSQAGAYITIHQGTPAGPVIASGVTPLAWTSTVAGTYYAHWNTNAACGTAFSCVTSTVSFIPPPCIEPAGAGITASSTANACSGQNFTLSLTGASTGTGLTYQWQSSLNGVTYSNISGATSATYVANQTVSTYYQCIVTCSAGVPATSTPLQVNMSGFLNCYCTSIPTSGADEEIYNVRINNDSTNTAYSYGNGCSTIAPGPGSILNRYSNFKTLAPMTTMYLNSISNVSIRQDECDGATYYSNGIAVFIDYNQNGLFTDPGEKVYFDGTVTAAGPRTVSGSFTVPVTAIPGNTVMRVMCIEGTAGSAITPCQAYSFGETEDYLVTIACPNLTGTSTVDQGICSNTAATFTGTSSFAGSTISWWDSPVGGTQLASGTSFTTPALTVNTNYYVQEDFSGCPSSTRDTITAIVTSVAMPLTPVNVTCNGGNNGSFTAGAASCGVAPFTYSIDNGTTYGAIPTNLTAGTYFVLVQDAIGGISAPIQVIITQPTAPTTLSASGVTFYNGTLSWTATGDETSYNVEYGPAGFVQGTGTMLIATNDSIAISGLTENTAYEFYVQTGCGAGAQWAGPFAFSTDVPFFTYDNQCGPGWIDISSTGTPAGFASLDDDVVDVTLPWSWNVNGQTVSDIGIGTNGHVAFGTGAFVTYSPTGNGLYICNADLQSIDANGAYYQSIGTAPNRQFVIQWVGMQDWPAAGPGSPSASFEIIVDEASGEVYYIYDNAPATMPAYNAMAGIDIAVYTSNGNAIIQTTGTTNIQNNSCYHFYNALCPNVQNFSGIIFSDDALLDWNPGAYNESAWTLIYGPAGFDPLTSGSTLNLTSSDANFGGTLTQLTTYDVYIYSECAADGLTSDGFFYQFTTKPYCADPTTFAGTTDVDSLNLTWNWIANPGYGIQQFNIQYSMEDLNNFTEVIANGTNNADTIVDATLIPSGVYEVYVQAACLTGDTSNWVGPISLVMPLENDTTCGAPLLNVDETQYIFNNTGATTSLGENAIAPNPTGAQTTDGWINSTINGSLWYKFVAPSTGSVRINSTGRAYDGQIGVYELTNCDDFNTFSLIAANDDEIGGISKAPNFTVCGLTPGSEYYILFDGFNGTQGEFAIKLKEIVLNAGTANPTSDICTGEDIVLFTTIAGFDNGGTWSSAIPSVNASITDSLFTSVGLAYQTFDFEYRVVDGCAYDTIISQVHIFAPSSAGLDGTITACRNQPINLFGGLNGTADLGGQWYDPSNNPTSDNVTTLNFAGNYNYDYIVGNGVCPDDTANVVVTVTSCNHLSIDEEIFDGVSIHPNPTAGILFIESGIQFDMTITDANGRFVTTNTSAVAVGTTSVDLSTVERGVYFVNLTNGNSSKVYRVIVQ
jgi:Ig-like domain CHU_C associated/GEVED domain/Secretion system C-terminal sorting domain/SprB repeat/Fibronectin type III domain